MKRTVGVVERGPTGLELGDAAGGLDERRKDERLDSLSRAIKERLVPLPQGDICKPEFEDRV